MDCCGSLCAWNDLETLSTPSVLSVRSVPGALRAAGFAEADRVLLNATPVNGLSAPTPDRPEICQVAA